MPWIPAVPPRPGRPSALEDLGRVVPRLPAGKLEAAPDLGVAVDADDLLAPGALPAFEPVGRALQVHPRSALVAHLTLRDRRGAGVLLCHGQRSLPLVTMSRSRGARAGAARCPRRSPGQLVAVEEPPV